MGYNVAIRRNEDGAERVYRYDTGDWDGGASHYMWSDGNYGCDCNRSLFFQSAAGEEEEDAECGEVAYTIVSINDDEGNLLYFDGMVRQEEDEAPVMPDQVLPQLTISGGYTVEWRQGTTFFSPVHQCWVEFEQGRHNSVR